MAASAPAAAPKKGIPRSDAIARQTANVVSRTQARFVPRSPRESNPLIGSAIASINTAGTAISGSNAHTTTVDDVLIRARSVAINFEELPFDVDDFYVYLGIPSTYAETASTRAQRIASPESCPTLWNLQLSLLVALGDFEGSRASDTFQAYNEVARDILFSPGKSIQLAAREHDLQADDDEPSIAPDQQTLSDALGEAFAIPGVEATSERDLTNTDAQRVQNTIQESLSY